MVAQAVEPSAREMRLKSYARGEWVDGAGSGVPLVHAVTGEQFLRNDRDLHHRLVESAFEL